MSKTPSILSVLIFCSINHIPILIIWIIVYFAHFYCFIRCSCYTPRAFSVVSIVLVAVKLSNKYQTLENVFEFFAISNSARSVTEVSTPHMQNLNFFEEY